MHFGINLTPLYNKISSVSYSRELNQKSVSSILKMSRLLFQFCQNQSSNLNHSVLFIPLKFDALSLSTKMKIPCLLLLFSIPVCSFMTVWPSQNSSASGPARATCFKGYKNLIPLSHGDTDINTADSRKSN